MRYAATATLASIPGIAVIVAAIAGWAPSSRDLPSYFVPLRTRTAAVVRLEHAPFWNESSGCGEPYFANPQTGVLYPPAWLASVLPGRQAVGVEIGLHLALLGVGCAFLAGRLGAKEWLAVAAGWGVAISGPVVSSAGVLNNLDTLAWIPFLWWAALGGSAGGVAVFLALAYLGGEPQLAALAAVIAMTLSPTRRTATGLGLGLGLVAIQLVPFAAWAAAGDRGPGDAVAEVVAGAVRPGELAALLVPGATLPPRPDRFVSSLTIPAWGVLLAAWALFERKAPGRRLAAWGWILLAASMLAGVGWFGDVWAVATLSLVRFPGRLLFVAVVALVPAAAAVAAKGRGPVWVGAGAAGLVAVLGSAVGAPWPGVLAQAGTAALTVIGGPAAGLAALAGAGALAVPHMPALHWEKSVANPVPACLIAQSGRGRVFAVAPSGEQVASVAVGGEQRAFDLGWGYTELLDGRLMARTFAPLHSRALAEHLAGADRGPSGWWWLDSLAATTVVAQYAVAGMPLLCRDGPTHVLANRTAWPEASVVRRVPTPGEHPLNCGTLVAGTHSGDRRAWRVEVEAGGGMLLWLSTPDRGWSFTVDGEPVSIERGPGIIQGVPIAAGDHRVEASYSPPGLLAGGIVTLMCLVGLLGVRWRFS